ncbi:SDR family NAD(P)-dependent oxidoreductase [Myroides indicus]|uniref:Short-subunit dehydrogenase n=1 Tax=Myroides indicus TaxID=1323422 RepID=A0A4R7EY61_9FLAO|nr:SDR family NAD(P)-dependent oxidoreductase [Myroides indicus]TDS53974.1 hypothetical protein C8P70_1266 [Myroides indicus]
MQILSDSRKPYAVVTGASQGLGASFVKALAKQGFNIIMVSLPGQNLKESALKTAAKYSVKTACYETDLTQKENILNLAKWINSQFSICMLINNAGSGGTKKFIEADIDYLDKIIQLNIRAISILTHQLLPNMMEQHQAYVLNVSSMAAFSPMGYKTVYPASKTFVHSFSRGLYQELKDTNVFVSVINPGAMKTNPEIISRIEKQGILGKLTLLDPDKVAQYALKQLLKKDSVIMVNGFSWLLLKITPIFIKLPLMTRAIKRELSQL